MYTEEAPSAVIDRVASVLEVFVGQRPLTLAEIARRCHLPNSSTHRILQRLVELSWVERSGFEYALGIRMFELGAQVVRQRSVYEAALPVMTKLHRQTGHTVYLSLLVGPQILHLERVGLCPNPGRGWRVGARQPAELTAAGQALLASLDPMEWPELAFAEAPTCYSVRSRVLLDREIQRVRDRGGIAVDAQGCALGVTAVAAPVWVHDDKGPVALSLCGQTQSLRTELAVSAVRRAAADIWRAISGMSLALDRSMAPVHLVAASRGA
jgi:DNA-binding IclR family transcriptional regulator